MVDAFCRDQRSKGIVCMYRLHPDCVARLDPRFCVGWSVGVGVGVRDGWVVDIVEDVWCFYMGCVWLG